MNIRFLNLNLKERLVFDLKLSYKWQLPYLIFKMQTLQSIKHIIQITDLNNQSINQPTSRCNQFNK